eukprot:5910334-Amphidinium_carterae.1
MCAVGLTNAGMLVCETFPIAAVRADSPFGHADVVAVLDRLDWQLGMALCPFACQSAICLVQTNESLATRSSSIACP